MIKFKSIFSSFKTIEPVQKTSTMIRLIVPSEGHKAIKRGAESPFPSLSHKTFITSV